MKVKHPKNTGKCPDILKTIKPIPSNDDFFICFAIKFPSPYQDYFFQFMKDRHYTAFDGGVASSGEWKDWLVLSFYDNTPEYLIVIKDILDRSGSFTAVAGYCLDVKLNHSEIEIVKSYIHKVYFKLLPTKV